MVPGRLGVFSKLLVRLLLYLVKLEMARDPQRNGQTRFQRGVTRAWFKLRALQKHRRRSWIEWLFWQPSITELMRLRGRPADGPRPNRPPPAPLPRGSNPPPPQGAIKPPPPPEPPPVRKLGF